MWIELLFVVAFVGFQAFCAWAILQRARFYGHPPTNRRLLAAFGALAGPVAVLAAWWYAGRPGGAQAAV